MGPRSDDDGVVVCSGREGGVKWESVRVGREKIGCGNCFGAPGDGGGWLV